MQSGTRLGPYQVLEKLGAGRNPESLVVRDLTGARPPQVVVERHGAISGGDLSPDARWIPAPSTQPARMP